MTTTDSRKLVLALLRNNGTYPGDPQLFGIYSYTNMSGVGTFKLCYDARDALAMFESPFVADPVLLWSAANGLTAEGHALLGTDGVGSGFEGDLFD